MENQTPTPQSTTTMRTFTFDGMPVALASLHEKCDTIIALLSTIASSGSGAAMHTPIGMTEASKLLGKSPSTIYDMTSGLPTEDTATPTIQTKPRLTLTNARPKRISKPCSRKSNENRNP